MNIVITSTNETFCRSYHRNEISQKHGARSLTEVSDRLMKWALEEEVDDDDN